MTAGAATAYIDQMSEFSRLPQLITYPDSLGGSIPALNDLLGSELSGVFGGGVHLLPPFPSSADRGFAPLRYDQVSPEFGRWNDLQELGKLGPLTLDVMVNHISRMSPEFQQFTQSGLASESADMFMRPDKLWPNGEVPQAEIDLLFLRKPKNPFLDVSIADGGATQRVWATFGSSESESEQIDLDWTSPLTLAQYDSWFESIADAGASEVRLDAVGYVAKRRGSSCFMIEPETWEVLELLARLADQYGLTVLPEIHATPEVVDKITAQGYPIYDFQLPGLMVDALNTTDATTLVGHIKALPANSVTTLDTHDGIPIQPDLVDVLPRCQLIDLTADLVSRGANVNRILGAKERGIDFDAHQVNISYLDAAGGPDQLVAARAIQLFSPGRPQVYYQGLLGGKNDLDAVKQTGEGRSINRTNFSLDEAKGALGTEVCRRQIRLVQLRSEHPAFQAERPTTEQQSLSSFTMRWEHQGAYCQLQIDLADTAGGLSIEMS